MKGYSVKFYPEKRNGRTKNVPVLLSVTYSRRRMFYYTGERCNTDQWDIKSSRLKKNNITPNGETSTTFNANLDKIKVAVDELFKAYEVAKIIPIPEQLKNDLKERLGKDVKKPEGIGFFDRYEQFMKDANIRPNTKKKHGTAYNKIKAFNADTTFESIDVQFLTDFQNFLYTDKINGNLSKNSVISILKNLRTFIIYAERHGWTISYPFKSFKIEMEAYGDPIFLSIEERDMLYNAEIENECLARVRDIFIFQCLIGCRVGSLIQLNKSNIIDGCIEYIDGKNPDRKPNVIRVPLTKKVEKIIEKYDLPNGDLLPYISPQKYNEYIRKLFKLKDLKRMVTILDKKTGKTKQVPLCDIASSHMARRVFIGNLHRKGVKNEIIASMSGHVENSKAFSRYYNIDKTDQSQAMKQIE